MKTHKKMIALSVMLATQGVAFAEVYQPIDVVTKKPVYVAKKKPLAYASAASDPVAVAPARQPDLSVTLGFKLWMTDWQSWNDPRGVNTGSGSYGSANALALNPTLMVKTPKVFASVGLLTSKAYDFPGSLTGAASSAKRTEFDLSGGFYVHPQVALALGYKQITQTWGATKYVWKIPNAGLSATAPLQNTKMVLYGNVAVGYSVFSTSDSTAWYWAMKGGMYTAAEIGAGYTVSPNFRMTAGYRYQTIPTSMEAWKTTTRVTFTDTTRGLIFGGSYTF